MAEPTTAQTAEPGAVVPASDIPEPPILTSGRGAEFELPMFASLCLVVPTSGVSTIALGQVAGPLDPGDLEIQRDFYRRLSSAIVEMADLQAATAAERRSKLVQAMMGAGIDPVPHATIEQARRLARHRTELLASGAYSTKALAELRGDESPSGSATRTWLKRQRDKRRLFSVRHEQSVWIPAFQLAGENEPRRGLEPVLRALEPAELGGWATWTWFTSSSAWLSGQRPADLLDEQTERVARAAERFASNAVPPPAS